MQSINRKISLGVLSCAMLLSGLFSLTRGKELCWDFANYHFYNPFAFIHQRWLQDYWPSSFLHAHLPPTIDFLGYFLVNYFPVISVTFIIGAIHGINFWLVFLIALDFLENYQYKLDKIGIALLIAALGMYGPTVLPGLGSFQNDNLVSIFVLGFVLLQCRAIHKIGSRKYFAWSSLLLGIAVGLKLTASVFVMGAFITYALLPITLPSKIKLILLNGFAVAFGFILSSAYYWILILRQHRIFQPIDLSHYSVFFPHEHAFYDFRYPITFILFIIVGSFWIGKYILDRKIKKININIAWLYLFFIFSYLFWEFSFPIPRYLASLEMLTPLLIFLLLHQITKNILLNLSLIFLLFCFIAYTMVPINNIRYPHYDTNFFNLKLPAFITETPKALVLISYPAYAMDLNPRPLSYLIPLLPSQWRFVGMPFVDEKFHLPDTISAQKISALIKEHPTNIYLLTIKRDMPELYRAANNFGLIANGQCEHIYDDRQFISHQETLICPVTKSLSRF